MLLTNDDVCPECNAAGYGNFFCQTCRTTNNKRYGWNLPPWPHPAEKPAGAEEVLAFRRRLDAALAQD